jgi:signal peptidase I
MTIRLLPTVALALGISVGAYILAASKPSAESRSYRTYEVVSASMEPTLHCANAPGCERLRADRIVVSEVPYIHHNPSRGDIVVISFGGATHPCFGDLIVKRVIGVAGDEIGQRLGHLSIENHKVRESYLAKGSDPGPDFAKRRVRTGRYFVMGDNRGNSCDSRDFGQVSRQDIVGKVVGLSSR